ncbi:hypothetical protein [Nostoc sp. 'Peltigera malacea cyanobiont' DB3992]|uniref:hypothetical protein n=1 Tax=Nostoc sp. 'Peltigera malacea cyanobiont' DB3992 TaxID=1206980 RepID=UPI000C039BFE|nr:hypothetical protein [Nostoc sp. 'Peltigera malacea cyanobiont' DB3992]PHM06621.1 hypothetical protein CK516_32340 [Nostoc sp. 'Peltigera malacea cyanobiont' DB3992]
MLNIDKMLETTSANQDLFVDLNEKDAETVSGGLEVFTVRNETGGRIPYTVDGTLTNRPYGDSVWTTGRGGIIDFDTDFGLSGVQSRKYNLADGRTYAFRYDTTTSYTEDIDLYDIT